MKILHTADWHLGKTLEGYSRLEEQALFLNDFVKMVHENDIDLVIIAGDVYDSGNPPSRAEALFYECLKAISQEGKRLTLVISGNHDNPDRLVAAGPLAREHGILMAGLPKSVIETGSYGRHQVLRSGEGFVEIEINNERAVILTIPYPSEKRLSEVLYTSQEEEEDRAQTYAMRLKGLFETLEKQYRSDTINLMVSHLFAMGSEESGSERSIQLGGTYIVGADCFPKSAQYVALGHVHKPQIVPGTDHKVRYSGSPIHYNKKEISFEKKCLLIEAVAGEPVVITELPVKTYKPIEIWHVIGMEGALEKAKENVERDCWVYFEIETEEYIREDQIKELRALKKDIIEIMPIMKQKDQVHSPDISLGEQRFEDLFKAFYEKERGLEPSSELVSLLLDIISEEE